MLSVLSVSMAPLTQLRFSQITCNYQDTPTNSPYYRPEYELSGDTEQGVTLKLSGNTYYPLPYVFPGEFWRENEACFQAIVNVTTENIAEIGYRAFSGLERLQRIEGDEHLVRFGPYSFANSNLSEIVVKNLERIDEGALQYSTGISGIFMVPYEMRSIGSYAFQGTKITGVDVTNTADGFSFGDGVFSDCLNLRQFVVNERSGAWDFKSVGLFEGCISLNELVGLQRSCIVGARTFKGCRSLDSFPFNEFCMEFGDYAFEGTRFYDFDLRDCSSLSAVGNGAFKDCRSLYNFRCTREVAEVVQKAEGLFEGCLHLDTTYWSSRINDFKTIPARFFYGCASFDGSVFAQKDASSTAIQSIGESAFEGTATSQFDLSAATCSIGIAAFRDCQKLDEFTLPTNLKEVPARCFEFSSALLNVYGTGVTSLGSWAFYRCSSLIRVDLSTVENIGPWAFYGCVAFGSGSFLEQVKGVVRTIGAGAFERTAPSVANLQQCEQLDHENLPPALFRSCSSFRECTLSPKTPFIPPSFFEDCPGLATVTWEPESDVAGIGTRAFSGCSSFSNPQYFTINLGDYAFAGTGFTEINLPAEPITLEAKGLFKDCHKLTSVNIGSQTEILQEMFAGCENLQQVTPAAQIHTVGAAAFKGCSSLTDLTLLNVWNVGFQAFAGTGYTSIDLGQTPDMFGDGAFQDCQNLELVRLGSRTNIPDYFFAGCSKLSTIEGLDRVTSFGPYALMGCPITSLPLSPDVRDLHAHCFEGLHITSLDMSNVPITRLEEAAVKDCKSLTEVKLYHGLQWISAQAFQGCESLRSITIPASVVEIGTDCFRDCTSLETVTYEGTSEITHSIFGGCDSLRTVNVPSNYPYYRFGDWQLRSPDGTNNGEGDGGKPVPPGGIAGIVIAVLIVVGAAVFVAVFFLVIRKRRNTPDDDDDEDETVENTSSVHI